MIWWLNPYIYPSPIEIRQSSLVLLHAFSSRNICTGIQSQTRKTAYHRKTRYPQPPTRILCLRGQCLRTGRPKSPNPASSQKHRSIPLAHWLSEQIPAASWSLVYTWLRSPRASMVGSSGKFRRRFYTTAGFRIIRLSLHFTFLFFLFQAFRQSFSPQISCWCQKPCQNLYREVSWLKLNKWYSLTKIEICDL